MQLAPLYLFYTIVIYCTSFKDVHQLIDHYRGINVTNFLLILYTTIKDYDAFNAIVNI